MIRWFFLKLHPKLKVKNYFFRTNREYVPHKTKDPAMMAKFKITSSTMSNAPSNLFSRKGAKLSATPQTTPLTMQPMNKNVFAIIEIGIHNQVQKRWSLEWDRANFLPYFLIAVCDAALWIFSPWNARPVAMVGEAYGTFMNHFAPHTALSFAPVLPALFLATTVFFDNFLE